MEKVIENKLPNEGRQIGIDLAKCLAIIFMITIHCLMEFDADTTTTFYKVVDIVFGSILAAPVFMTAMGVGLAYSKKNSPKQIIFRGINIFLLGFLLNFIRVIPDYIIAGVERDSSLLFKTVFYETFCGDILPFAGLALILFGLLKLAKFNEYHILLTGLVLSLIGTFIPLFITDNIILNILAGQFFITQYVDDVTMAFPILSWFIFPCFGYWYGMQLKKANNPNYFHLIVGGIGSIIAIVGFILSSHFGFGFVGQPSDVTFYGLKCYDALFCLGAAFGLFGLCHFITKISPMKLNNCYSKMSDALNLIYMIHWPLILYISLPTTYYGIYYPLYSILLIDLGIIIVATTAGILLKSYIRKKTSENPHTLWRYVNA